MTGERIFHEALASIRLKVFRRDGYRCQECGFTLSPHAARKHRPYGPTTNLLTLDHIVPKAQGGTFALDNLRTLCADCQVNRHGNKPWWMIQMNQLIDRL